MDMERKSFIGLELKKDKPGTFLARFARLNVIDKDGDVTLPGAAPSGKKVLLSSYMHGSWSGSLTIGAGTILEKDDELLFDGEINLNMDSGKEHYEMMKFAPELVEFSYGFKVLELDEESEWNENPKVWRVFKRLDIFEISPVLRGAGVDTGLLSIKNDKDRGLTFAAQAKTALAAVNDLISRAKSLADLRRKEGRDLSNASREEILKLQKELGGIEVEIKSLLEKPDKDDLNGSIKAEMRRALATIKFVYGGK
jgi:hypothetical protein